MSEMGSSPQQIRLLYKIRYKTIKSKSRLGRIGPIVFIFLFFVLVFYLTVIEPSPVPFVDDGSACNAPPSRVRNSMELVVLEQRKVGKVGGLSIGISLA